MNTDRRQSLRWLRSVLTAVLLCNIALPLSAQYSKYIQAVDEYRPAPGQFVNEVPLWEEGDTEADMVRKCNENLAGVGPIDSHLVTLGGWGGYITFHFDHPVANIEGQRDFAVWGNASQEAQKLVFGGMNEAGIVMVSKDVNQNGRPDDPWYEISGSCDTDSAGKVLFNYAVTYRRNPMGNIPWTDNCGNSGTIDRIRVHSQEYYPQWVADDEMTFQGTRLPDNMVNLSNQVEKSYSAFYYVLVGFRYGYADNLPNWTDLSDAGSYNTEGCGIDISWAVDEQRNPVSLDCIHFVRVYTGLNQKCPQPEWSGETSTEIAGAEDLHLQASLDAWAAGISTTRADLPSASVCDLQGRRLGTSATTPLRKGIYIRNGKKYIIK